MRAIWKFPITCPQMAVPTGAIFRSCAMQGTIPCMWMEIETTNPLEVINVYIYGTGHTIPDDLTYLGSYIDGPYVWHLYKK